MSNWFTDALFAIGVTIALHAVITHHKWSMYLGAILVDAAIVVAAWKLK